MGKKAKEHRKKVAKRNARVQQQKTGMQKAFEKLIEEQMTKMKEEQEINAKLGAQDLNFEVVDEKIIDHAFSFVPNPEESAKINKEFEPEYDSAGYTIEDRELPTEE
jgi:hypothetical protein